MRVFLCLIKKITYLCLMSKTDYRAEAKALLKKKISVIPVKTDGSKLPKIKWAKYQNQYMTDQEVEEHFKECGGVIALCGPISNLICIDFDLKYQLDGQDYWQDYLNMAPKDLLAKCRIHTTRSGGKHIWFRTTYSDKSRKITKRLLTPMEIMERYENFSKSGANHNTAMDLVMRNPTECVIETRLNKSYGVFLHESYSRDGDNTKIGRLTEEETRMMLNAAYALDCGFKQKPIYTGSPGDYSYIEKYLEDATGQKVVDMLEKSGMYSLVEMDGTGNFKVRRFGTDTPYSAYVYQSGVFKSFGTNLLSADKNVLNPYEIFCIVNGYDRNEGLKVLKEIYENK